MRLRIEDEGHGRFRGTIGGKRIVGVWKGERGVLQMCWRAADKGYPASFEGTSTQEMVTMWRR